MTAHQIAKQLLDGPDLPVQVLADVQGWNDIGEVEVQSRPDEGVILLVGTSVDSDGDEYDGR